MKSEGSGDGWRVLFDRDRNVRVSGGDVESVQLVLTSEERRLLEQRRVADDRDTSGDRRPSRSLSGRLHRGVDRWSVEAGWVAAGLQNALVTVGLGAREIGERRRTSVPDPTSAAVAETVDTVEREAVVWAHVTGRCRLDGLEDPNRRGRVHVCPDDTVARLADKLGIELPHVDAVVDGLIGTPATATVAFNDIAGRSATWHSTAAATVKGAWHELWRDGAESARLDDIVTEVESIARRTAAIAGRVAGWSGREEPRCECGGRKPADKANCGRCRTAQWRQRRRDEDAEAG